jgi:hypothetical protein
MPSFSRRLRKYSDPKKAQQRAIQYLGPATVLYPARTKNKKYSVYDTRHKKWVNFGQLGYEDFTKHRDNTRRRNYLRRSRRIRGSWKDNKYSPNSLSIHILW